MKVRKCGWLDPELEKTCRISPRDSPSRAARDWAPASALSKARRYSGKKVSQPALTAIRRASRLSFWISSSVRATNSLRMP